MIGTVPKREKHKRLSPDEIDVTKYYRLVDKVLNRFQRKFGNVIMQNRDDLFAHGLIGLMKAKDAYDPSKGTYVTLAYLRVHSNIWEPLMKILKYRENNISLEDTKFPNMDICDTNWEEQVEGVNLDYEWIGSMLNSKLKRLVYFSLLYGYNMKEIMEFSGESRVIIRETIKEVKAETMCLVYDIYGSKYEAPLNYCR